MNPTSASPAVSPPETQEPSLPAESVTLAPEKLSEAASTTTQVLHEILERGDDRYYSQHWGINE
jgi:hypothetical protein